MELSQTQILARIGQYALHQEALFLRITELESENAQLRSMMEPETKPPATLDANGAGEPISTPTPSTNT